MKRFFTTALAMMAGAALMLASALALLEVTLRVELMESLLLRLLAELATMVLGVVILVASAYLYIRLTVFLCDAEPPARL